MQLLPDFVVTLILLSLCSYLKYFCAFTLGFSDYSPYHLNIQSAHPFSFVFRRVQLFLIHMLFSAEVIPPLIFNFSLNVDVQSYTSGFDLLLELQTYLLVSQ